MTAAKPSLMAMPSAPASNGRQWPPGESACVLAKHRYANGFWMASTPPTTAMSLSPLCRSRTASVTAASDEPQAASTVKFAPPRSSRLAIRPAATFISSPGKLSSVHSGSRSPRSSMSRSPRSPSSDGSAARTV